MSKFVSLSEHIAPPCIHIHSHIWLSYPWFRSQHTPSFQSLSQWSPCLVFQKAHSFHHTSTVHTWTVHKEISLTWSTWPKCVSSNKFVNDAVSFIHFSTDVTPAYNYNNGHCVVRENRVLTLPFSNKRVNMTTTGGFWSQIIWMKSEMVRALGPTPLQQSTFTTAINDTVYRTIVKHYITHIHLVKQCRQISDLSPIQVRSKKRHIKTHTKQFVTCKQLN